MRRRNLILVFLFIFLILPLIWVIINLEVPDKKSTEQVNLSNSTEQSNIYEDQEKLLKFLYDNKKRILENKKVFLIDVTDVLPVVEEKDINNSTVQPDLNIVKSERQKQYEIIKKVLREADYYHLTGKIRDNTVYSYLSDIVKKALYSDYKEEEYTYYYKVEPANPDETVLRDRKGYFYYVYVFTDSYEVNPADPYGDIKKLIMLVEKIKGKWVITELTYNN
ncbi:MAG: hypothetical protein ACPL3A_04800 [Thermoanaerobacteraceae bacterium]|uniref:Uncharacterized protein n=1 Tax=Thermoanaerobacter uzonensis DSM 18761 TaxID=1123369 RepID=A0A1M4XJC0_9THEO|nr:hypothetical protein [Thermoanaerobacter uzonensis]SHE93599.1 hypothetical protein SAMN02745195_01487 [Thermoanaerobacter uzonensis DSM 18761]